MQNFNYFHEAFNLRKLSSYFLNIELSKYGISYVISDAIRNQYIAVKYYEFENPDADIIENFQSIVKDDVYLNKHYKSVNFFLAHNKYTLVPADLFDKNNKKDFLKYNHTLDSNEEVHFSYLENIEVYSLYTYPSVLINFLVNHFPEIKFYHSTIPFASAYVKDNAKSNSTLETVAINFYTDYFDILVLKNKKLTFLNDFEYSLDEDAVYFIVNILKKLNINISKIDVVLQGRIDRADKVYSHLSKFIPNLKFKSKFEKIFPFKQIAPHFIANSLINF